jgi:hypothetical protein
MLLRAADRTRLRKRTGNRRESGRENCGKNIGLIVNEGHRDT